MYFFTQSQKSKPTKYTVLRKKLLMICNQSCTCFGPSGPWSRSYQQQNFCCSLTVCSLSNFHFRLLCKDSHKLLNLWFTDVRRQAIFYCWRHPDGLQHVGDWQQTIRGFSLKQRILLILIFVIANSLNPESNSAFLVYTQAMILRCMCFVNSYTRSLCDV